MPGSIAFYSADIACLGLRLNYNKEKLWQFVWAYVLHFVVKTELAHFADHFFELFVFTEKETDLFWVYTRALAYS